LHTVKYHHWSLYSMFIDGIELSEDELNTALELGLDDYLYDN